MDWFLKIQIIQYLFAPVLVWYLTSILNTGISADKFINDITYYRWKSYPIISNLSEKLQHCKTSGSGTRRSTLGGGRDPNVLCIIRENDKGGNKNSSPQILLFGPPKCSTIEPLWETAAPQDIRASVSAHRDSVSTALEGAGAAHRDMQPATEPRDLGPADPDAEVEDSSEGVSERGSSSWCLHAQN